MDTTDTEPKKLAATNYVSSHEDVEVRRMYGHHYRSFLAGWDACDNQLQQENDRLRLALSPLKENGHDWASVEELLAEYEELHKYQKELQLQLSGKTGYDQVEVERERLRKEIQVRVAKLNVDLTANYPHIEWRLRLQAMINENQRLLSLLSSPVSGDVDKTK